MGVEADQAQFNGLSVKEQTDLATKIIKERYQGKVIGLENRAFVNGKTADEYTHPAKHIDSDLYEAKLRASTELDNLMDAGFNYRNSEDGQDGHTHPDVTNGFDYFDVIFKVGKEYYQGIINIKNISKGKLLKDITKIKNITEDMTSRYGETPSYAFLRDVSMDSISPLPENVNTQKHKQSQFEVIQATNPMWDDYHTGIRSVNDIRTWEEVLALNDESEGQFVWGDFSREDAEQALKDNSITVYSSHPIENGAFVSTSYIQAREYAVVSQTARFIQKRFL